MPTPSMSPTKLVKLNASVSAAKIAVVMPLNFATETARRILALAVLAAAICATCCAVNAPGCDAAGAGVIRPATEPSPGCTIGPAGGLVTRLIGGGIGSIVRLSTSPDMVLNVHVASMLLCRRLIGLTWLHARQISLCKGFGPAKGFSRWPLDAEAMREEAGSDRSIALPHRRLSEAVGTFPETFARRTCPI